MKQVAAVYITAATFYMEDDAVWVHVYRVREDLPFHIVQDSLECKCIYDIDPGIYKEIWSEEIPIQKAEDLVEALENEEMELGIKLIISDILEMLPDTEMLNMNIVMGDDNFLIITDTGVKQIAVDKASVFRDLPLKRLQKLFDCKYERYL